MTQDPVTSTLTLALARKLRPGEVSALGQVYAAQARRIAELEAQRNLDPNDPARARHVELSLDPDGAFRVQFPGAHSVRIPVPAGATLHALAAATASLQSLLEARTLGVRHPVASPGAATQEELALLARSTRIGAKRLPPPKRQASREELSALLDEVTI